jgi:ectoine hydroxylase-related dioxygenase (phytanoyl-CoA dioxygenase family)
VYKGLIISESFKFLRFCCKPPDQNEQYHFDMIDYTADAASISDAHAQRYREAGFLRVRGVLSAAEAERFRVAADRVMAAAKENGGGSVFRQFVNTWRSEPELEGLTLHPTITRIAELLAGVPMRLWHDHLLVKEPRTSTPTHFHQDQPFWPHANSTHPISCWVALNDVPVERGCMSFIPGSHRLDDLSAQNLRDAGSLFGLAPELAWEERVTLPLRAGDCTFHHGRTAHMANANVTDDNRYGFAIIYIDATTTYSGSNHVVTDPLRDAGDLESGSLLEGDFFPLLADLSS